MKLVIGNRNYSSWSLRAWLYLRQSDIEFDEVRIPLFDADWAERIGAHSPARWRTTSGHGAVWRWTR